MELRCTHYYGRYVPSCESKLHGQSNYYENVMKKSELNEWLSLLANIGVLFGIFILVMEVNQNTRAIDNESSWARVSTANDVLAMHINNSEFTET